MRCYITNSNTFVLWHNRLGHPESIMIRWIIENSNGHPLKNLKVLSNGEFSYTACYQGKLIVRPSLTKVDIESPTFLKRIHMDICGPIRPPSRSFRYFMVLIDVSSIWYHACLLSTRNLAFAKLLAWLWTQFFYNQIKCICLDNATEISSQILNDFHLNDYCLSIGIKVEHPVTYVHTQNGFAESLFKCLHLIARPLLMKTRLPSSGWGHGILHIAILVRLRPSNYDKFSPLQLILGQEPNISHLRIFFMCYICACSSTTSHKNGSLKKVRNLCWVWIALHYSLPWTINWEYVHCSICRLSVWWDNFSKIRGRKQWNQKRNFVKKFITVPSWSTYFYLWTRNIKNYSPA